MKKITKSPVVWMAIVALSAGCLVWGDNGPPDTLTDGWSAQSTPRIQIALLLDTSSSMGGLIEQAKSHLWKLVNEFIGAQRHGQQPELQVALLEYGNGRLSAAEGYIRLVLPLTSDLDKVSQELFALTAHGHLEYCGQVISDAVEKLAWSGSANDLKVIFIAGNEPFTQGPVDYRESCRAAISKGIVVNTIFCGQHRQGIAGQWKDGATLAEGGYMNIDQNRVVVHIEAPQDPEIARLGELLNETYISFGSQGHAGVLNQVAQDANARSASPGSSVERAVSKASGFYRNSTWDLVDAVAQQAVHLEDVEADDLPELMREMSMDQRRAYVRDKADQRRRIQEQIRQLDQQRRAYVAQAQRARTESDESNTLDEAMVTIARQQAVERGFTFE